MAHIIGQNGNGNGADPSEQLAHEMTPEELAVVAGFINKLGSRPLKAMTLKEARLRYNAEMTLRLEGYEVSPGGRWIKAAQEPSEPSADSQPSYCQDEQAKPRHSRPSLDLQVSDALETKEKLEIEVRSRDSKP